LSTGDFGQELIEFISLLKEFFPRRRIGYARLKVPDRTRRLSNVSKKFSPVLGVFGSFRQSAEGRG
jgi:hypothetical protein